MYLKTENTATSASLDRIKEKVWMCTYPKASFILLLKKARSQGRDFTLKSAHSHKVPVPTPAPEQSCHFCLGDAANKFSFGMAQLSGTSSL